MTQQSRTAELADLRDDMVLLEQTMLPYAGKGTVYLNRAATHRRGGAVVTTGDLGFEQSCYIEETGHFNAVEFVISYNQLIYYTLAAAVRDHLVPGWNTGPCRTTGIDSCPLGADQQDVDSISPADQLPFLPWDSAHHRCPVPQPIPTTSCVADRR